MTTARGTRTPFGELSENPDLARRVTVALRDGLPAREVPAIMRSAGRLTPQENDVLIGLGETLRTQRVAPAGVNRLLQELQNRKAELELETRRRGRRALAGAGTAMVGFVVAMQATLPLVWIAGAAMLVGGMAYGAYQSLGSDHPGAKD